MTNVKHFFIIKLLKGVFFLSKQSIIGVRVTEDFKTKVSILADKKGLTASEYVRYLLMKELEKEGLN